MSLLSPQQSSRVDALFADIPSRRSPGCVIGLLHHGEVRLTQGFGLASIEHDVPITANTRFRIASVSKQFTVAAVLMLARQGRMQLDDEVRVHVPELPELAHRVTLEHLMRNSSGLPDFLELLRLGGVGLDQRFDRSAMLQAIQRCTHLNFEPGSRFLYCNSNFLLLGLIVERLSGQTLGEFLKARIFEPLGMKDTELVVGCDTVSERLAAPYLPASGGGGSVYKRALHGFEHGGEGGLVSSVGDLLRWAAEMLKPGQDLAPIIAALQDATVLHGGHASPYARGLEHSEFLGRGCVGHGGLWPGYRTEFVVMPAEQMAAVVITNDGGRNPYKLARELMRIALDAPAPESITANLSGEWFDPATGQLLELYEQAGALMARQWGVPFELKREADGSWLPQRGAYEFRLCATDDTALQLDLGAGRVATLERLTARAALPTDLQGSYRCEDIASTWRIDAAGRLSVEGPNIKSDEPWQLLGLGDDCVELRSAGYWMRPSQVLRIEREASGHILALCLDSARVKGLRFTPV